MPIDPSAVGAESGPVERSWTSKDALLYAVGVGAGTSELPFTTENSAGIDQQVLPTFAVIVGAGGWASRRWSSSSGRELKISSQRGHWWTSTAASVADPTE